MKTFAQYLAENTGVQLSADYFPLISTLPMRYGKDKTGAGILSSFFAIVNPAIKAGTIPNPVFQDAKSKLGTIHEVIKTRIGEDHFHAGNHFHAGKYWSVPEKIRDLDLTLGDPHHVPGKAQKLEAFTDTHPAKTDYLRYAKEFTVLLDALNSLKDKIVKRQPKANDPTASPTYIPPMASGSAIHIVTNVLTTMTNELKHQYADHLYDQDVKAVEHRIANPTSRTEQMKFRVPDMLAPLMHEVGEDYDNLNWVYRKLKSNYHAIIRNISDDHANFVQQQFLAKNVRKLAKIIELKKNLRGIPTTSNLHVSVVGFSGEVLVRFEDGSEFTVRNKVVEKQSVHRKQFLQFPTTFHNVKLPSGRFMPGQPSEKEMIEDFAGGKASDVPAEDGDLVE